MTEVYLVLFLNASLFKYMQLRQCHVYMESQGQIQSLVCTKLKSASIGAVQVHKFGCPQN